MSQDKQLERAEKVDPLVRNQLIGGSFAGLVIIFACIRIFPLHASTDVIFANLMSVAGAALSLVVLTSAVRIMLAAKKTRSFNEVLADECDEIDKQYGALIETIDERKGDGVDGMVYMVADNVDAIFTSRRDQWESLRYEEIFDFSPNFAEKREIHFYVNHDRMTARAAVRGESLEITAKLLARDIAVAIQRSFSDTLTAHALEISQEAGRSVVTITVNSAQTSKDAERIGELIDYMLFLHFVTT